MGVYLLTKFDVSSVILTSFRQGRESNFTCTPQNESLKSPSRLGLAAFIVQEICKMESWKLLDCSSSRLYK